MSTLGTLGFPAPPGNDYIMRLISELRGDMQRLGPSVARSFEETASSLRATVDTLSNVVAKLSGLRTYASLPSDLTLNRPAGPGGAGQAWTTESVDLTEVIVPPGCDLLVTVSCASGTTSFATAVANEHATSQLSFNFGGGHTNLDGVFLGSATSSAFLTSYSYASVALTRSRLVRLPPGTYTLRAWGGGYHSSGASLTTHSFLGVTLVAQVIPGYGF